MAIHCIPQYSFPPWHLPPEKNNFVSSILPSRIGTIRAEVYFCLYCIRTTLENYLEDNTCTLFIYCVNEGMSDGRGADDTRQSDGAAELTVRDTVSMSGKRHIICRDKKGSLHPASWPMWLQPCGIPTPPSVTPRHLESEIISFHCLLTWSQWFLLSPRIFQT